jgi:hypothetical protein
MSVAPAVYAAGVARSASVLSSKPDGDNMIRTQVSLDEHEYAMAKTEARSLGISVAEFVRRAIREALPPRGEGPWMKFAGFVETGNPRSSQSIDEIVYGQKD